MGLRSRREILELVERRMQSSSGATSLEMKRGLGALATIASTAPLIGLFGTVVGLLDAFKGCGSARWACFAAIIDGLCEALISTALGLLVAIPAAWVYNYLSDRLESFHIEMELTSRELLTYLTLRLHRSVPASDSPSTLPSPSSVTRPTQDHS